jgi:hypothetical protein
MLNKISKKMLDFNPSTVEEFDQLKSEFNTEKSNFVSHKGFGNTTGANNSYEISLTPVPTDYENGMTVSAVFHADSTGVCTLNVNGLGAKVLKKPNGDDLVNLKQNGIYTFIYNSTTGNFIVQGEGGEGSAVDEQTRVEFINAANSIFDS